MGRGRKTDSVKKQGDKARYQRFKAKQINIGEQADRWIYLKGIVGEESDSTLAKLLIDNFWEKAATPSLEQVSEAQWRKVSTPQKKNVPLPTCPGISSVTEGSDTLSCIEVEADDTLIQPGTFSLKRKATEDVCRQTKAQKSILSAEHVPKVLKPKVTRVDIDISTTDLEDFYDVDYDPDDPTYQPHEWDISIVQSDDDPAEDTIFSGIDEDVFDIHPIDEVIDEGFESFTTGIGIKHLKEVNEADMTEQKYIVCRESLETLLQLYPTKFCVKCEKKVKYEIKNTGCTVISTWVCEDGHESFKWSSSPMLPNGVYSANLQAVSSVVVSGNNFTKISLFAKFLGLTFPGSSSFSRVQNKCVVPVVDRYWNNIRNSALEEHRAVSVIVSGDGRMDSPGHCAKYCTYTIMNQADKNILAMEIIDKRETGLKSGLMEAKGFARAMETMQFEGVEVKEMVTDAHPQISSIMKKSYQQVRHSYDMWHGAKNLGKKICKIANVKGNENLKPWLKDITNHFFHSAETCNGNVLYMKTKWFEVMNHITNRHSWALGQCDHGPIEENPDKPWLKRSSNVVKDLEKQVMEKRLIRTFPYYVTCQTTSELETFNNHLLMYAPKRNAFSYDVYKCRCQLAAIDYSKHISRKQQVDKNGKPRNKRVHSKAANNWTVVPLKEPKQYTYIPGLLAEISNEYCSGYKEKTLTSKVHREVSHPKNIARTIAPKSPPPTLELEAKKISRIKGKDSLKK